MNTCAGCCAALTGGRDTYGDAQAFCLSCWLEEIELMPLRKPWLADRERLLCELEECEIRAEHAEKQGGAKWIRQVAHAKEAAEFRLADVELELACLTVAYQRSGSIMALRMVA